MIRIGLTGSIAMGKSATAALFAEQGATVWDADAAVARLYGPGAAGARALSALVPEAVDVDGVDRTTLLAALAREPALLSRIEAAVHPLVAADREDFLRKAKAEGAELAVCDIPLLYETGAEAGFDAVVVASAPAAVQRARALARPGMTPKHLAAILARQTPDSEKRARADFVVDTGAGFSAARRDVARILDILRAGGDGH